MTTNRFLEQLKTGRPLVLDGATGTSLQRCGLPVGMPSDLWVMDNPQEVMRLHAAFIDAGSDIFLTDTFGSSRLRLRQVGIADRFEQTNRRAVELARQAASTSGALVAGSMGPLGEILSPLGSLDESTAEKAYAEQAGLLADAGVDLLVIETQYDLNEAKAAVRGALSATSLPLVCSFSFDRGMRTMMGIKPSQVGHDLSESGVAVLGINCGYSPEDNLMALRELRQYTSLPLWFKPNAGMPRTDEDGGFYYDVTPEMMASRVPDWIEAGALMVGGCCGTSPEHIRAVAQAVRGLSR